MRTCEKIFDMQMLMGYIETQRNLKFKENNMSNSKNEVTEALILASLIKRNGSIALYSASVQRSHRFPIHLFTQIENMARMANVSVSMIINQLLAAGIEAVQSNLTTEEINEIRKVSDEQMDRPFKQLKDESESFRSKKNKAK